MNRFPENLKAARTAAGMTQPQLATKVGVTKSIVSQWEGDSIKQIGGENLLKASKALGVSPDWLLHGDTSAADEIARCKGVNPGQMPVIGHQEVTDDEAELLAAYRKAPVEIRQISSDVLRLAGLVNIDENDPDLGGKSRDIGKAITEKNA